MFKFEITNDKVGEIAQFTAITVDDALIMVGSYLAEYANTNTANYLSQAEVNVITSCMRYAIEQIKASSGAIEVFDMCNTLAGEEDLREQLDMAAVAEDIMNMFVKLIDHESAEAIIIE